MQRWIGLLLAGGLLCGGCIDIRDAQGRLQAMGYYDLPGPSYSYTTCSAVVKKHQVKETCVTW